MSAGDRAGASIHLRRRPGEIEAAVLDAGGTLLDHALDRPGTPDGWGDLHRARVGRAVPALGGTFVALATGEDAFLPDRERPDGAPPPREGASLPVRVTRSAGNGKGPRVTARLDATERASVAAVPDDGAPDRPGDPARLIRRGPTALDELLGRWPAAGAVALDPSLAAFLAPRPVRLASRDRDDADALADALDALRDPVLALPGGACATFHPTPALVAIDVDWSGNGADRAPTQAAQLAANRALLPVLLRAIRLRDLAGAILVDLAGLAIRKRALLGPDIVALLADDERRPRFLGFTALGLAEIVRARRRPPLHERLAGPHARALDAAAALLVAVRTGRPVRRDDRFVLRAAPPVARAFADDPALNADLARDLDRSFILRADPSLGSAGWSIDPPAEEPSP